LNDFQFTARKFPYLQVLRSCCGAAPLRFPLQQHYQYESLLVRTLPVPLKGVSETV